MYTIRATVISQQGICEAGHKVGDEYILKDHTPLGICSWAYHALFPFAEVLQFGGSFPWESPPDQTTTACPDPENPVVWKLKRE